MRVPIVAQTSRKVIVASIALLNGASENKESIIGVRGNDLTMDLDVTTGKRVVEIAPEPANLLAGTATENTLSGRVGSVSSYGRHERGQSRTHLHNEFTHA